MRKGSWLLLGCISLSLSQALIMVFASCSPQRNSEDKVNVWSPTSGGWSETSRKFHSGGDLTKFSLSFAFE